MQRSFLLAIIVAWMLGVITALAWPSLTTERTMLASMDRITDTALLHDYALAGWIVTNATTDRYYVLERPRVRIP